MRLTKVGARSLCVAIVVVLLFPASVQAMEQDADSQPIAGNTAALEPDKAISRVWLRYGDGKPDGKKSIAGSGEMIRFELPAGMTRLRSVKIHGARYGSPQAPKEEFEVAILSDDMSETLHSESVPYATFKRTKKNRWTPIRFQEPVEVPSRFWVVLDFNPERTKGVYVSFDTSTKGEHSRIGLTDEDARKTDFQGDWMVQVWVSK